MNCLLLPFLPGAGAEPFFQKWNRIGLGCFPTDREAAAEGAARIYHAAGRKVPRIIWRASPNAGLVVAREGARCQTPGRSFFDVLAQDVLARTQAALRAHLGKGISSRIRARFETALQPLSVVRRIFRQVLPHNERFCGYGCHAADWLAGLDACFTVFDLPVEDGFRGILRVAENSGWWWPFPDVCVMTDRPIETVSTPGPSWNGIGARIAYSDGWGAVWLADEGILPLDVVRDPSCVTLDRIAGIRNVATRRAMIERYGVKRYLEDSGAELLDKDDFGELYRKNIQGDEPIMVVKVLNATPEPGGSFKDYFLRVPPAMRTARQAVAWTFGFARAEEYDPEVET